MIRSFADKMKAKQKAYKAEQKVLAEQAEQARIQKEQEHWKQEWKSKKEEDDRIVTEELRYKEQQRQDERERQNEITKRRIDEWETDHKNRLTKENHNKKIISDAKSEAIERYIAYSKQKPQPKKKRGVNEGAAINASGTWQLTWKSFSTHPDVIDLPMSEKIRLFKQAERKQRDKLDYYANLHVDLWQGDKDNVFKSHAYWSDGIVDLQDIDTDSDAIPNIIEDVTWNNSVDVNIPLTIAAGVTLTVIGILTTNALITNYGTIRVNGVIIETVSIVNEGSGQVIVE
jgi:hypothetical protein